MLQILNDHPYAANDSLATAMPFFRETRAELLQIGYSKYPCPPNLLPRDLHVSIGFECWHADLKGWWSEKTLKISQDTQECFICDRFWCSLGAVSCCFQTSCNENLAKPTQYFKLQTHQVSSWVARGAPQNGMVSLATSRMSRSSPCSILVNLHLPVGCLARGRAFTCQVLRSP